MYRYFLVGAVLLLLLIVLPAAAQDADGDGTPDEAEMALGMDPRHPDSLVLLHDDKSAAEGDRLSAQHKASPDMTRLWFGNVAGDRYVWRLDFVDDFPGAGIVLILYVDADNRLDTGRQDGARGCDVMLTCVNGGFEPSIRNDEVACSDRALRGVIAGKSVYFSMDLKLKQLADGRSEYRAWGLCHLMEPNARDQDSTVVFVVQGPGTSDRPKPKVAQISEYRSDNMDVQTPWLGWRRDLREMKAVALDPAVAQLRRMRRFDKALVPEQGDASATYRSPVAGDYHLGIVIQDSAAGADEIVVRAAGKPLGRIVGLQNDGAFHLFTVRTPVRLRRGDAIELRAATPLQDFQISEVLLCPRLPAPGPLALGNLAVYCPPQAGDTVSVDVCFTSSAPCAGGARWGEGGRLDRAAPEEAGPGYNHRIRLSGLRRGGRYRVQAVSGKGYDAAQSSPLDFLADRARPARCGATKAVLPLNVSDALAEGRPSWPVNGGLPLPRGALAGADHCRLLDAAGQPFPAQFRELGYWPDGSVKWLLVSLVHPAGQGGYTLEYGEQVAAAAAPAESLTVEENAEGLVVTNGRLRTTLSRTHFAPPGEVRRDADGDGTYETLLGTGGEGLVLTDAAGNHYGSAGAPVETLEVEEAGPIRTVVAARGRLVGDRGKLMSWRCRMTFYRGFPAVPTVVTLLDDEGTSVLPPTMTPITSLVLSLRVPGAQQPRRRWLQDDDNHLRLETEGRTEERAGRGEAFASAGGCTLALQDFWQRYPKAFTVEGETITAELLPALPADVYAAYTDPRLLTQHYYWARQGKYLVPMGTAPSADLLFYFGERGASQVAAAWQAPVLLATSPDHYCDSGAFADLSVERAGSFDAFAKYVRDGFAGVEARRERGREYSWIDYGDWYGERSVNWGNQEYDLQWGLLLQFARSGELRFFDRACQAARHTAAIDTVLAAPQPSRVGIQSVHALGHTGGFAMARVPDATYWFESGGANSGHMWSQGTYAAYCLTGDPRYLEAAEALANWLAGPYLSGFEYYVHRNYGWPTVAVLGGYDVTANPYYLNAARLFTQYVIARQDPGTGVFAHPIGECTHKPLHMGGKVFMSGAVMTGMKMLDRLEPSDELKQAVVRNCDWMYNRMWHPRDNSFQYAQCTDFDNSSTHAGTYEACEGLAYAYDLTKTPAYREMLVRSLTDAVNRGATNFGKEYAMEIRMTPYAVSAMERWGLKEFPALPPPEPKVSFDNALYLLPGEPAQLFATAENRTGQPLMVEVRLLTVPAGLETNALQAQWQVPPIGLSTRGLFHLRGTAAPGAVLKLECKVGEARSEVTVALRPAEKLALGAALGYVGSADDAVGRALAKLGRSAPRLDDLRPATLASYGALLVGAEAHAKDYAGLRAAPERLLDFVYSGGRVAVLQLQDAGYLQHYLPWPLVPREDDGTCGDLLRPEHALFNSPKRVAGLKGLLSYDTIGYADPRWTVLAKDNRGGPAILQTSFGQGRLLVIQPSVDRYAAGDLPPAPGVAASACADLMTNVLEWLGA